MPSEFVLYGGTAIALHLGHRSSVDFDFFSSVNFQCLKLSRLKNTARPMSSGSRKTLKLTGQSWS
ncbi:MAG: nucleotidyl transferase AbiEii/AbiGii toxin family protein [Thermodesulfobacteriota bacterium]